MADATFDQMPADMRTSPVTGVVAITAGSPFTGIVRGLLVGADGDVNMTFIDGSSATLALTAGTIYPFVITSVASSGTDATGIIGLR